MELSLALYAEGPSDNCFLPLIIERTTRNIIDQRWPRDQYERIALSGVKIIPKQRGKRDVCILSAAREACKNNALNVHSDADDKTTHRAQKERIQPGFDLVLKSTEKVCEHLIPLIPVQMTEAWMLADREALLYAIGVFGKPQGLRLPNASEVERDANPKHTLNEIVRQANLNRSSSKRSSYRRKIDISDRYEYLAGRVDLSKLALVPSYQTFRDDLIEVLTFIFGHRNT